MVLVSLLAGRQALGQELAAPGDPGFDCDLVTTEQVCDDLVTGKCEALPVCHDSSSKTYGEEQGEEGENLLDVNCDYIRGANDRANDIFIGTKFIYRSGAWQSTGLFAYCKNGAMKTCDTVNDPLPVEGREYSDVMGTTGILRVCVANNTAIGPWSYLTEFQSTRLELYGCQNGDTLRGSPNGDKLIGGGYSDTLYGLEGADIICGDYETGGGYECRSDDHCDPVDTSAAGGDSATGGDGDDAVWGHGGNDYLWGGRGCDYVSGLEGSDHIYLYVDSSTSDQCATNNEAHGGDGADYIYAAKDSKNRMWGDGADDYILGSNGIDWICGGNGVYDSLDGKGGDDIVVDCLGLGEVMNENIGDCDHSIYGNTDKDTVCYKKVGTVNVTFCVNGGSGTQDKCYCDPDAGDEHCNEVDCEYGASLNDCSANGAFSCNCT